MREQRSVHFSLTPTQRGQPNSAYILWEREEAVSSTRNDNHCRERSIRVFIFQKEALLLRPHQGERYCSNEIR